MHITPLRRPTVALLAASTMVAALLSWTPSASADPPRPDASRATAAVERDKLVEQVLGDHDSTLLSRAESRRTPAVTVIMSVQPSKTADVAAAVRRAGGSTLEVTASIGAVIARVPTSSVEGLAALGAVQAIDLDEVIPFDDPDPRDVRIDGNADAAAPGADTPDNNPYLPTQDTRSTTFKARHAGWDGRGVTIGILDTGIDVDHPALQTTSSGEPKITDVFSATDPAFDADPTWLRMGTTVSGPTFTFDGRTWTAPGSGTYAVAVFAENTTSGADDAGDINRDRDTSDRFGVLLDPATHDIWVDADQDLTFGAADAMAPFAVNRDIGHFGVDDPATAVTEAIPFTVEYQRANNADYVNIGAATLRHGTHVAGIAAGHGLFGGSMDGQAPGAKLVAANACLPTGCTSHALLEGMIALIRDHGVDVVNMSIGGLPALNDGNNARAELYDRLIDEYGVQIVLSGGNDGPGLNTIGDPAVTRKAIAVGASVNWQTWQSNYGSEPTNHRQAMFNFSSRGPAENGAVKPDVVAPGSAISTIPTWQNGIPVAEAGYPLPPGYGMLNGTSMAAPQTAGAIALLLSAAKAKGLTVSPRMLRDSLFSTAVALKPPPITAQGNGLVRVTDAWAMLRRLPQTHDYTVRAPVCTPLSGFLADPNHGPGVYNRCAIGDGGQELDTPRTYDVTVTRTSGPSGPVTHALTLAGNDGTFSVPATVDLDLDTPTVVTVTARTRSIGVHAAMLRLDDTGTGGIDGRVPLTVLQAVDLAADASTTRSFTVGRNLTRSLLVSVPSSATALQVRLDGVAAGAQVRWIAISPQGLPADPTGSASCFTNFSDTTACNPTSRSYSLNPSGVWELEVEARRTSPQLHNRLSLTASAVGLSVDPATQTLPATTVGQGTPVSWTVENPLADVTATPSTTVGSARIARPTITDQGQQQYAVDVPSGVERLSAAIGAASDARADLDLFLFRCLPSCVLVAQSAGSTATESVALNNPAAGRYVLLVDAFSVPSGSTEFDYRDVMTSSGFGSLEVPTTPIEIPAGGSAPLEGAFIPGAVPTSGRVLLGTLSLGDRGAVLARADVVAPDVSQP